MTDQNLLAVATCPITMNLLDDPLMCKHCSANFSRLAIVNWLDTRRTCPLCRHEVTRADFTQNRSLAEALPSLIASAQAQTSVNSGDGMTYNFKEPFKLIVAGAFGVGKSATINLFTDPSGDTDVVLEGNGAEGVTKEVKQVWPVHGGSDLLGFRGKEINVRIWDAPGFNDPERTNQEMLRLLSDAMVNIVLGMDAVLHFVRFGRMTQEDRDLPQLLVDGLADTEDKKKELAKRYIIIVTHTDSKKKSVTETDIIEFRTRLSEWFPECLKDSVQNAVFIENSTRSNSPYADVVAHRDRVFGLMVASRQVYHQSFRANGFDAVVQTALTQALTHQPALSNSFKALNGNQLCAVLQHFQVVREIGEWVALTRATPVPAAFAEAWNSLSLAVRNEVALGLANKVHAEISKQCKEKLASENTRTVYSSSSSSSSGGGCFPRHARVVTKQGTLPMDQLQIGDFVQSGTDGEWDMVVGFYDYDPAAQGDFIQIHAGKASTVKLTSNHLIYASATKMSSSVPKQALNVVPGAWVVSYSGTMLEVSDVTIVKGKGMFSPATRSGRIIVDGVLCSAYAKPRRFADVALSDERVHRLLHFGALPLRLAWRARVAVPTCIAQRPTVTPSSASHWAVDILKNLWAPLLRLLVPPVSDA